MGTINTSSPYGLSHYPSQPPEEVPVTKESVEVQQTYSRPRCEDPYFCYQTHQRLDFHKWVLPV